MDPVSQAALGAAWTQAAARGKRMLAATTVGAMAGMAADLDTLIRSDSDPLLALEYHRHFTHSLIFLPAGAFLCALLLYPVFRRQLPFAACFGFSMLGYATHGLLDACTSYGTMLLWPFSDARVAWNIVSVVDPLLTLPLVLALFTGIRKASSAPAVLGFGWCVLYLGFGVLQHARAESAAEALAGSRGHTDVVIVVKPSFANLVVWKTFYAHQGRLYVDAVRTALQVAHAEGQSVQQLVPARDFPWLSPESAQWRDVQKLLNFADGFVAVDPLNSNRIMDMRYSLVPNRADGFWGLELDPVAGTETHAAYVTMRIRTMAEGRELVRMIFQGV